MAALSPRKFRTDFSDFLRGGHQQGQSIRNDAPPSLASALSTESLHVPETPGKSKSRLPFLGRSRKKSSQVSDIDESDVPPIPSQDERLSVASATESEASSQASPSFLSRLTQRPKASRKTSRNTLVNGYTSDSLVPPSSGNPQSFESTHASRSTTPRPKQPTITVLLSPDNMSDYHDLFTQPQKRSHLI
ncbi:hypothetical protein BDZ89DRAFT_1132071 [Hymenopellis radicata]|nr:hypothetical protein BDZ89DRAFT_1132071 [Hymenopellis radicata]